MNNAMPISAPNIINSRDIRDAMVVEEHDSDHTIILKVRRPDYLGSAQWEFRHGSDTVQAPITDIAWLRRFQSRQVRLQPRDAIRCRMRVRVQYGANLEPIQTSREVVEVIDVIEADTTPQVPLQLPGAP